MRKVFEDTLKAEEKTTTSYKQLNLLIQNLVHRCSNGWITCLFDVTAFSRNDGFNAGPESLTCTHHMVFIDFGHYSVKKEASTWSLDQLNIAAKSPSYHNRTILSLLEV